MCLNSCYLLSLVTLKGTSFHQWCLFRTAPVLKCTCCSMHSAVVLSDTGRGETSFPQMLADAGFAADIVPDHELHEEYQGTDYCLLRACKLS